MTFNLSHSVVILCVENIVPIRIWNSVFRFQGQILLYLFMALGNFDSDRDMEGRECGHGLVWRYHPCIHLVWQENPVTMIVRGVPSSNERISLLPWRSPRRFRQDYSERYKVLSANCCFSPICNFHKITFSVA